MQDLDNPLYTMLSGVPGRYIQIWQYSDVFQLDFRTDEANNLMVTPMFEDVSEPFTSDVREGFIFAGDIVQFTGQFAFKQGIFDSVYINPEVELTMESRQDAAEDFNKDYIATPVKSSRTLSPVVCSTSTSRHPCSPTNTPTRTS